MNGAEEWQSEWKGKKKKLYKTVKLLPKYYSKQFFDIKLRRSGIAFKKNNELDFLCRLYIRDLGTVAGRSQQKRKVRKQSLR